MFLLLNLNKQMSGGKVFNAKDFLTPNTKLLLETNTPETGKYCQLRFVQVQEIPGESCCVLTISDKLKETLITK